jgi:hypothetical protein
MQENPQELSTNPHANQSIRRSRILVIDDGDSVGDVIRIFWNMPGLKYVGKPPMG